MHVVAYTDGSCNAKSKLGGAGSIVRIYDGEDEIHRHEISDAYSNTKTGRMEITAVISTLMYLYENIRDLECVETVHIVSDSQYVVNSISNRWIYRWRDAGWLCANSDLWMLYIPLSEMFKKIKISWVKGHNGDEFNEIADKLASSAYRRAKSGDCEIDEFC